VSIIGGITMNKPEDFLRKQKSDLLSSINETMEKGKVDREVLEIMKELVDKIKIKNSMEEYFDDID
jgi:tRNA(Phe) wybutosine-synthesizing methylase Tyw3